VLSMVSPIPVAAPDTQRDNISVVHSHELKSAHLGFELTLLCFEL
jgi:hypothetical protein